MTTFASGKHALAISDRSGLAYPYLEMVREWNGSWVHFSEFEPNNLNWNLNLQAEILKHYKEQDRQE